MSSFSGLLTRYHALPLNAQRAASAVVGAFVADAATRPTHWVYDRSLLESTFAVSNPEFWSESLSPFYSLPTGRRSCYSDEAYTMLQSLTKDSPHFSQDAAERSLQDFFAPNSEYADAMTRRLKAYDPSQRTEKRSPISGPWQQAVITHYLKAVTNKDHKTAEPSSSETDGFCFSLPLIAMLSVRGDGAKFDATVKSAVEILTSSETAVVHSAVRARILRELISTAGADAVGLEGSISQRRALVDSIVREFDDELVTAEWNAVLAAIPAEAGDTSSATGASHTSVWGEATLSPAFLDAVQGFGKACPDPGNFQSALLALVTCGSYTEGVRRNLLGGGCNCSRANFLGACLGATYRLGEPLGIPLDWVEKTDKGLEVLERMLVLLE